MSSGNTYDHTAPNMVPEMDMQTIRVTEGRKCAECGGGWATESGLCLRCVRKAMTLTKTMKSELGRAVQANYRKTFAALRKSRGK